MKLWRAARVIIDPSIHTGRMSVDQAVSYILGMRAIESLRDEARTARSAPALVGRWWLLLTDH